MDIEHGLKFDLPQISARFAPVYWEPMVGSAERITALVAIEPELGSSDLTPTAHLILPLKRLKAMLGIARGSSAHGILGHVADFMTSRLNAGLTLEELDAPFGGFTIGNPRSIKAFSEEQVISGAVQMVSALGDVEDILEADINQRRSSATTLAFLRSVQADFSVDHKERRKRFFKRFSPDGTRQVTLDYAYEKWLVQFASLPSTLGQAPYLAKEAESKILELITARKFVNTSTESVLIINRQPMLEFSGELRKLADDSNSQFSWLAQEHGVRPIEVTSKHEAVSALESFA
ncbi:hypothetical protein [Janthinobacterium lividum]|uniref:hypothetical protein n=1 Tax=Janthinobacterium lividum TaxID=29581 RepID=UPI00140CBEE2|nr:hypothetical protein [Janthinobacterium lividum]NHQ93345.1 hypothetical protein [Janthinobacterium lividum]